MMKKTKIILPALAVILVIGLMVGPALAYFTAHTEAKGDAKINLGFATEIEEFVDGMHKEITISNKGPQSVWVRATAFSAFELDYSKTTGWTDGGDGYWYYNSFLAAGDDTGDTPLVVEISTKDKEAAASADFNIIVLYECAPVLYDANGNPSPASATDQANWNIEPATEAETTEGGGN